jgi:hypothetical protein
MLFYLPFFVLVYYLNFARPSKEPSAYAYMLCKVLCLIGHGIGRRSQVEKRAYQGLTSPSPPQLCTHQKGRVHTAKCLVRLTSEPGQLSCGESEACF